jgi:hypothetical protein
MPGHSVKESEQLDISIESYGKSLSKKATKQLALDLLAVLTAAGQEGEVSISDREYVSVDNYPPEDDDYPPEDDD